jgi:hypothetical protein
MQNKTSPSIHKIARASRQWLKTRADGRKEKESLSDLASVLMGLYLCDVLEGTKISWESESTMQRLSGFLGHRDIDQAVETRGISPLLLVHCLLSSHGISNPELIRFSWDTSKSISSMQQSMSPGDYASNLLLLDRLQLISTLPQPMNLEISGVNSVLDVLTANQEKLYTICDQICAATFFGTSTILNNNGAMNNLTAALPPLMLAQFRMYDLEMGALLLRCLIYLNQAHLEILETAVIFLENQQRPDGSFGYFSYELANARSLEDPVISDSFYLSVTISCLWTIAEIRIPGFRLMDNKQIL